MIAVFSDLHGNASALQGALPEMSRAEALFCLGDTVGYRRNPEEAARLVRQNADLVLQGNHDAAATGAFPEFFEMIPPWLGQTLRDVEEFPQELWEWLASLRPQASWGETDLVHGSLRDPLMEFLEPGAAPEHLALQRGPISLAGHTHEPLALGWNEELIVWRPVPDAPTLDLSSAERWALNPGYLGARQGGTWMMLEEGQARWRWL